MSTIKYITARDGTKIAYYDSGSGSNTVVLSNGIGCNDTFLRYLLPELESRYRVVHWHYRGHQLSEIPRDPSHTAYHYLIDDLEDVLRDAQIATAAFIGFSMGVEMNFEFYRRNPHMVQALVPICGTFEYCLKTFFNMPLMEYLFGLLLVVQRRVPRLVNHAWKLAFLNPGLAFAVAKLLVFNPKRVSRSDFSAYLPHIAGIDTRCFLEMGGYLAKHTARDLLPHITCPTLIIAGENDTFTPVRVSREMAALIPGARLVEIAGGTHGAPIEYPELVNAEVLEFLQGVYGQS